MKTAATGTAVLPVPVKIVRADPPPKHGPAKKFKTVTEECSIMIKALAAARSTRTPDGLCHAIVDGGVHVAGQLWGATPAHVFLDHHAVPIKSVLAAATPTQKVS
jgi:hypothetical protein